MKTFHRSTGMNRLTMFSNILLVVVGLNSLVFPTIWQFSTAANVALIVAGIAMLLVGVYRTAQDFLLET